MKIINLLPGSIMIERVPNASEEEGSFLAFKSKAKEYGVSIDTVQGGAEEAYLENILVRVYKVGDGRVALPEPTEDYYFIVTEEIARVYQYERKDLLFPVNELSGRFQGSTPLYQMLAKIETAP